MFTKHRGVVKGKKVTSLRALDTRKLVQTTKVKFSRSVNIFIQLCLEQISLEYDVIVINDHNIMKLFEILFLDDKMTVELMFFTDKRKNTLVTIELELESR